MQKKAELEAIREGIFQMLKQEEEQRRSQQELIENVRNELSLEEYEE